MNLEAVRQQFPVLARTAYFNTGTAAPWPTPVVEAVEAALRQELALGRASPGGLPDFRPLLIDTRGRLASWVGADPDELALTHSATEGIDIVVWGLDWRPGDEVVTTSIEHRGVLAPLRQLAQRTGVTVAEVDVGVGGPLATLDALHEAIGDRTRLVVLSHVSFSTGARLPIAEIARFAHAAGAQVAVDGAQAVGALPVDVHALDVEYYAFPGQKWLCGPEGTGGLFVRREAQAGLKQTFVGARSGGPAAARYEWGTLFRPGVHGLHAALGFLDGLGREAVFGRIGELTRACGDRLRMMAGIEVITPPTATAGLLNFRVPGADLAACVERFDAAGITLRSVPDTNTLRVSCGFFNAEAEIDCLVETVGGLVT